MFRWDRPGAGLPLVNHPEAYPKAVGKRSLCQLGLTPGTRDSGTDARVGLIRGLVNHPARRRFLRRFHDPPDSTYTAARSKTHSARLARCSVSRVDGRGIAKLSR